MKRSFLHQRSSIEADSPSVKRQKTQNNRYSTRSITWNEQRSLGGEFEEVGKNSWPISGIVAARGSGRAHRYQVSWERHPVTLEEFEPTWLQSDDVNDDDIRGCATSVHSSRDIQLQALRLRQSVQHINVMRLALLDFIVVLLTPNLRSLTVSTLRRLRLGL